MKLKDILKILYLNTVEIIKALNSSVNLFFEYRKNRRIPDVCCRFI